MGTNSMGSKAIQKKYKLRRQMTSIGRFSLVSQDDEYPSVISFFVALAHPTGKDLELHEFREIWDEKIMKKYERFSFQVAKDDDRYFEVSIVQLVKSYRSILKGGDD
jgi:hypothetical protein